MPVFPIIHFLEMIVTRRILTKSCIGIWNWCMPMAVQVLDHSCHNDFSHCTSRHPPAASSLIYGDQSMFYSFICDMTLYSTHLDLLSQVRDFILLLAQTAQLCINILLGVLHQILKKNNDTLSMIYQSTVIWDNYW